MATQYTAEERAAKFTIDNLPAEQAGTLTEQQRGFLIAGDEALFECGEKLVFMADDDAENASELIDYLERARMVFISIVAPTPDVVDDGRGGVE